MSDRLDQQTLEALMLYAGQLERDYGCEHTREFGVWCSTCRDQIVQTIASVAADVQRLRAAITNNPPWEYYGQYDDQRCFFCGNDRAQELNGDWMSDTDSRHHGADCMYLACAPPLPRATAEEK